MLLSREITIEEFIYIKGLYEDIISMIIVMWTLALGRKERKNGIYCKRKTNAEQSSSLPTSTSQKEADSCRKVH